MKLLRFMRISCALVLLAGIDTAGCLSVRPPVLSRESGALSAIQLPRWDFCRRVFLSTGLPLSITLWPTLSRGVVTDETDAFGDNWWTTPKATTAKSASATEATASDEVTIQISKASLKESGGLGLELSDIEFRTNIRVYVKSVAPNSLAAKLGIQKDWIVVRLDGQSTERTNSKGVAMMLSDAVKNGKQESLAISFRDPAVFRQRLGSLSEGESVTTQVAPAGDTTQRNPDGSVKAGRSLTQQVDQKISVSQIIAPKLCNRGATTDDLLEISYLGTVVETGQIFDGSAVRINGEAIPGRGNDVSLFFVLGKQPFGQFPPGWDVGLQGMCVGERRRLIIPPALAYGSKGVPRRQIPPDATLQYDITLVALNGLATPQ